MMADIGAPNIERDICPFGFAVRDVNDVSAQNHPIT